jgi:hypothetical protein
MEIFGREPGNGLKRNTCITEKQFQDTIILSFSMKELAEAELKNC